jgi:hypothetical protein
MHLFRLPLLLVVCFFCCGRIISAQTVLTFCDEGDLIEAFEKGGDYVMDCGTNIVTIELTAPLTTTNRVSIFTTNEVVITSSNLMRLMVIQPTGDVTMGGFTFSAGRQTATNENHGGIEDTAGGAIYNNRGKLRILRGRFHGNSVVGITGGAGGDGLGENGEHGGDAAGGAIYNNFGTISLSNVVFSANTTTAGPGGNGGSGRTSGFGMPGGNGGNGGSAGGSAIYSNGGIVNVIACTFTNNIATGAAAGAGGAAGGLLGTPGIPGASGDGVGAAISGLDAQIRIFGSTFIGNRVTGANGLDGNAGVGRNDGDPGLSGGDAAGSAIFSVGTVALTPNLWVTNSTFFRNSATSGRGGNGGAGSAEAFGFNGGDGGTGGFASGGAIDSDGRAWIVNCTFSENRLIAGAGGSGGAAGGSLGESGDSGSRGLALGTAIYGSSSTGAAVSIANSIMDDSSPSIDGAVDDLGGNITADDNPKLDSTTSFKFTDALLRTLANNGGLTWTMAIPTNSPAVNKGVEQFCVPIDQRGSNRVGRCDIGAFEVQLPAIPPSVFGTNSFRLSRTNGTILLQWPGGYTNLFLETTTNLLMTNTPWTRVTNGITFSTNRNSFAITNAPLPQSFFRLSTVGTSGGLPPLPASIRQASGFSSVQQQQQETDLPLPPLPVPE